MYVSEKDLKTMDEILEFIDSNRLKIPKYSDGFAEKALHLKVKLYKQRKTQEYLDERRNNN